jgi:hypothetical protein
MSEKPIKLFATQGAIFEASCGGSLSTSGREKLKKWVDGPSADAQIRDEQMVKVLCFDLLSRERITEHLQRIREHHAAKLFYYEDSLQRHREKT